MTDSSGPSIGRRVASGAGMMLLLRLGERLIGLVNFSICARVLTPADFGLVALATGVVALVEQLGRAGIDLALIQRRNADRRDFDAAWSANILIAAIVATILCALAFPSAAFFKEPRVQNILYFLATATFIAGFENIGTIEFQKGLAFHKELVYRLLIRVVAATATIAAAFIWRDFTALVIGYVAGKVGLVALSYLLQRYRPRFSLSGLGNIAAFSKWVLMRNMIAGLNDQAATFTIGRFLAVDALAFFSAAREIAALATSEILAPVRRAQYPGFAALSHDSAAFRRLYLDSTGLSTMLGLPIPVGLSIVAADFVRVLLGPQWMGAVPLIPILVLAGIMSCFSSGTQIVFLGLGRPRVPAYLAVIRFVTLIPALIFGAIVAGTSGVAWAIVTTGAVMFAINGFQVRHALKLSVMDQGRICYRPVLASVVMFLAVSAVQSVLPAGDAIATVTVRLLASVAIGAVVYVFALWVVWVAANCPDGAERHALRAIQAGLARLRRSPTEGAV